MSNILKGLNEGRSYGRDSWDSNMPGYQGDYGGAENFGRRNREWDEDDRIDARIRAEYEQKKQYEQNGKFWLKLKDSQRHLPAGPFVGKQSANQAAIDLLKQQPELKGNLLITAYGPDETQTVAESSDELYGLRVGDTVKVVVNGKRVQGDVIDIFPETQQVELLLRGAYAGKTVTVDVQDTESMMEASTSNRAVDSKGRTQAQWMDLVMKKFPDARLIQAKMIDGPVHAMLPDGRKLSWNKVQQQGVSEGWQEEAEEIGKWAEYVRTKLLQTPKEQRWPMAGQLSQIEVKNFGSKLIPHKNYDNKTGKPVAGQSYFTEIVQRTLRALTKPEGMTQAGYQSLTLTPQDIDKPDDRGGKDWVVDAPLGWLVIPNAGQAPGRVKRLLWKAYNAGPEIYPLALEVWEETGDFTEQDYKDIIIKAAKLRDSGGLEGQAYQQYNQQQGIAEGQLNELSPNTLASYKKKAGADASQADKRGDYARGNKRMSGIMKATKKEFDNDAKSVNEEELDENLNKWFKEKWVRFGPDGKIRGDCARGDDSEGKPKCLPQSKAQNLGKKGRASAAARKRREDPNPERSGKAINVNTKKTNEEQLDELSCWSGYHRVAGTKAGFPGSCAKNKTNESEHSETCPHCGGEMVSEELMNEKKDACYYKVKSRYKVWPSAYASGALVKCRKSGADSWGNGGKKNESIEEGSEEQWTVTVGSKTGGTSHTMTFAGTKEQAIKKAVARFGTSKNPVVKAVPAKQSVAEDQLDEKWTKKYKDSINCSNPKGFSQKAHCAGKQKNESAIMKGLK